MVTPALVWPGLEIGAAELARRTRACLSRAEKRDIPARDALTLSAAALGVEAPPAGALARLADGLGAEGRSWFRAAPVRLIPDRDSLLLLPLGAGEELTAPEAEALAEAAREHFGETLALERGASGRWYAALEDVREAASAPLAAVAGTRVDIAAMAQGGDATALRRFLNELQMLWYAHPVNAERRRTGRAEANALWLWGGGFLPEPRCVRESVTIQARAPEVTGLAIHYGLDRAPPAPPAGTTAGRIVVVEAGEEAIGREWLAALAGGRAGFRLYTAGTERRVPPRSRLSALFGW